MVVIGSGFGSSFFLHEALRQKSLRALVVEWGDYHSHAWQLANGINTPVIPEQTYDTQSDKPWYFTIGFGGGMNCWFAQTPRLHPNDFKLRSRYGVGNDWPITYDELEAHYSEAEQIMSISGDPAMERMFPRSAPYPQPPHRMTTADRLMKAAQPGFHFVSPTARARIATAQRPACCASLRCRICPSDAKFTAQNGFEHVYANPGLQVCLGSRAVRLETGAGSVRSLVFESEAGEHVVSGDLFVLGANAIHSPAILLRSGMETPLTGVGLHESYGAEVEVYLDGLDHLDGSTVATGLNFSLYDGPWRSESAAAMIQFNNDWTYNGLRRERGRWRQTLSLVIVTEDLPQPENAVTVRPADRCGRPQISYRGPAGYARRGMDRALSRLPEVLSPLPVEKIVLRGMRPTESHHQGTLRMGADPSTSVVDDKLLHHRWRNLAVVGTSVFPTCSCANPSLTAAALSLRSAGAIFAA